MCEYSEDPSILHLFTENPAQYILGLHDSTAFIRFCPKCGQRLTPEGPLAVEELKEMNGEPVWLETGEVSIGEQIVGCWEILEQMTSHPVKAFWFTRRVHGLTEINYGKTWLAYRHKPEV